MYDETLKGKVSLLISMHNLKAVSIAKCENLSYVHIHYECS